MLNLGNLSISELLTLKAVVSQAMLWLAAVTAVAIVVLLVWISRRRVFVAAAATGGSSFLLAMALLVAADLGVYSRHIPLARYGELKQYAARFPGDVGGAVLRASLAERGYLTYRDAIELADNVALELARRRALQEFAGSAPVAPAATGSRKVDAAKQLAAFAAAPAPGLVGPGARKH